MEDRTFEDEHPEETNAGMTQVIAVRAWCKSCQAPKLHDLNADDVLTCDTCGSRSRIGYAP